MGSRLSSEQLTQLTPLLGSLARLVAGGSQQSEDELHTLLLGVDLESNPAALNELRRWGRLFQALQRASNEAQRRATVEALLLRGLPEATVLLAVATVAGSGAPPTPPLAVGNTVALPPPLSARIRLHASVTNLDFGSLRPHQAATLEFDVQGGPGHVVVENDHVQVTPMQFGVETTGLRVAVKPLASGLLFTSLKLVTAGETLELPIMAQWQDGGSAPAKIVLDSLVVPPPPPTVLPHQPQRSVETPPPSIHQPQRSIETPPSPTVVSVPVVAPPVERSPNAPYAPPLDKTAQDISVAIPVAARQLPIEAPTMIEVPAGPFLMGSSDRDRQADNDEKPQQTLALPTYWIGKTEVTNAQFRPFVAGDGYSNRAYWTEYGWAWQQQVKRTQPGYWNEPEWNSDNQPVVYVSWYEAVAYCRWLSVQTGKDFRLPTEAEWEKAARGTDGRIYPWGNTWELRRANSHEAGIRKTSAVGSYPNGASPYGVLDMAGNVWEWTSSSYQQYPAGSNVVQPDFTMGDADVPLRGGGWVSNSASVRCAARNWSCPHQFGVGGYRGFRVVLPPQSR